MPQTIADRDKILKDIADYKAEMFQQYKMGKLEPDGKAVVGADTGPQVVINITRAKDNADEVVIEGTPALEV